MENDSLVQKLLKQQDALAKFGSFAFRATDLDTVLTEAATLCATCMEAPLCKICRFRADYNDLVIQAGFGWQPNVIGIAVSNADLTSPGGKAFVTRTPVVCPDLAQSTDLLLPQFYAQHNIISTVNVVIHGNNGDTPYGILEIDDINARTYDEQDVNFLTGFANVLAEAVATAKRIENLRVALDEKEVLSRELQHRVRNNLHLIYSMLNIEAEIQTRSGAEDTFREIANRVKALATVYDHLLGTGMSRSLAFNQYLEKLCENLREFQPSTVNLIPRLMPTVTVDLDTATALGIAVTEIITNSYKHAFPNGTGTIEIGMEVRDAPVLIVQDNGVGIDQSRSTKRRGLGLVQRLVEQINGKVDIRRTETGTQCEIILPALAQTG